MSVMITGAAGFIGYFVAKKLLEQGQNVIGVDNLNSYYDLSLKKNRLFHLKEHKNFTFCLADISDSQVMRSCFDLYRPKKVVHLAAQAGVRYSLENPNPYVQSNLVGFTNILEGCRYLDNFDHLVYASTSSVYGATSKKPFKESMRVETPLSFYAATKRANEVMAQSYHHLFDLPVTGLRFFTVYGPWGRPDMSLFKFTKAMLESTPIDVYNHGNMSRDWTYISDIVEGILKAMDRVIKTPIYGISHNIYNLGNSFPKSLCHAISILEAALGIKAIQNFLPLQPGDVVDTQSDIESARLDFGYEPKVTLEEGIPAFVSWYKSYYL